MSQRGTITEWNEDRGWGTLRLDRGDVLRFNKNACGSGVTCAVGEQIWVAQHVPYIGGQRRATSVQANAEATLTPLDLVKKRAELNLALNDRLARELGRGFDATAHDRVPHVDRQLALLGIAVDTRILAADDGEPLGVAYEPEGLVAWCPFDPCFIAFAGIDGDAWGFLCYPPLLARGHAPIVKWNHEGESMAFEAVTFAHWLTRHASSAKRKAWLATRGFEAPKPAASTALSKDVRAIIGGTTTAERAAVRAYETCAEAGRLAHLDKLVACYRALEWPDVLAHRADVQRRVLAAEAAYDAAVARITREHHAAHPDIYT